MLVLLRLALGWHFLYEGVWKLTHRDAFVGETEGFLSAARGPAAKFFYGMVPDIDGRQRLEHDLALAQSKKPAAAKTSKDSTAKAEESSPLAKRWNDLRATFVAYYRPANADKNGDLYKSFEKEAEKTYQRHVKGMDDFIKDNGDKIKAHFESLDRFREQVKADPKTDFIRQRRWDQMQEYRKEAKGWIVDLDAREKALKADLMDLLNKERKDEIESVKTAEKKEKELKAAAATAKAALAKVKSAVEPKPSDPPRDLSTTKVGDHRSAVGAISGDPNGEKAPKAAKKDKATKVASTDSSTVVVFDFSPLAEGHDPAGPFRPSAYPWKWKRIEQLATLLGYSLTAIGACLMLGFFTRLSALGGAAFMLFVVLSQPSFPGVYPPDPPQMGHALLVNKDFVEMIALLVIASSSLGRWTGMDFFLHKCLLKPLGCCCGCRTESEGEQA